VVGAVELVDEILETGHGTRVDAMPRHGASAAVSTGRAAVVAGRCGGGRPG
jgi:hypothetical protein